MDFKQAVIIAILLGLGIGVLIGMITELYEEIQPSTPTEMPRNLHIPPAPDVSALIEEARRITREASGE